MVMELTASQISFFKDKFDVDVTPIVVIDAAIDEACTIGNFDYITKEVKVDLQKIKEHYKYGVNVIARATITHELVHYCQLIQNKSLMLPINNFFTGKLLRNRFIESTWEDNPLEIDAVITECYYLYTLNGDIEQVREYIKLRCKRMEINTLLQYATRLNDKSFIECLNKSIIKNIKMNGGN